MSNKTNDFTALMDSLNTKAIIMLGVLTGTDSTAFYTVNDVATALLQQIGKNRHSTDVDFTKLSNRLSVIFSTATKKRNKDVRRTDHKIAPRLDTEGKMAYGYRIGMACGIQRTADSAQNHKDTIQALSEIEGNKMAHVKSLIGMFSVSELCDLQTTITSRLEEINRQLREQITDLRLGHRTFQDVSTSLLNGVLHAPPAEETEKDPKEEDLDDEWTAEKIINLFQTEGEGRYTIRAFRIALRSYVKNGLRIDGRRSIREISNHSAYGKTPKNWTGLKKLQDLCDLYHSKSPLFSDLDSVDVIAIFICSVGLNHDKFLSHIIPHAFMETSDV